jgi:undecaprenyl-diphosphatase
MGIPAMVGGSLIKALGFFSYVGESGVSVPLFAWMVLLIASVVAFLVSMLVIRFLLDFVKRHSFIPFGYYRIALGVIVLLYGIIRYAI